MNAKSLNQLFFKVLIKQTPPHPEVGFTSRICSDMFKASPKMEGFGE
jgi:hypothetical protein